MRSLHRRELLRLVAAGMFAPFVASCGASTAAHGEPSAAPARARPVEQPPAPTRRRHPSHRPRSSPAERLRPQRSAVRSAFLPARASCPDGALAPWRRGSGRRSLRRLRLLADELGLLVSPDSRDSTWDVVRAGFGPDVEFLDRALDLVFARYAVDPARIVAEGFSDGASYALSLGLLNGDLFSDVIAFSPGFVLAEHRQGRPRLRLARHARSCRSTSAAAASSGSCATSGTTVHGVRRRPRGAPGGHPRGGGLALARG